MDKKHLIDEIERVRARNNTAWMDLVRLAWDVDPSRAQEISERIHENDKELLGLSGEMAERPSGRRVLLPGGGILHTYAVREALALGLIPVVTDRDPKCPCAKLLGVEFHEIDCYDVESHLRLAAKLTGLVGAFCAGADTHVVVAEVARAVGSAWVSPEVARRCKNKRAAKEALLAHFVPTAALLDPRKGLHGTVIVKPLSGSGSRGVRRYVPWSWHQQHTDLEMTEEYLEGPEQSVEIVRNGDLLQRFNIVDRHFTWVDDAPVEVGHTNPSRLDDSIQADLFKLCGKAANAVGADVGFFKCDTILTKDGPKVLECTPRLSGGFDSQVSTPLATGRNPIRVGLQIACGLDVEWRLLDDDMVDRIMVINHPELATRDVLGLP